MYRSGNYTSTVVQPAILNPYERKSNLTNSSANNNSFKYSPPASLKGTNPKGMNKAENFTFKKVSDSQELASRNETKLEYFGTNATTKNQLKTQPGPAHTGYSVSPSFGVQNATELSYRKSLSNETLIVKNPNSHIIKETNFEQDFV